MAERRLPYTVTDDDGVPHQGELLIVPRWPARSRPGANAAFTIVLSEQPRGADCRRPAATTVAVCAPREPVRLSPQAAETVVAYDAGGNAPPFRLPRRARAAFAAGSLFAADELSIDPRDVFNGGSTARLDLIARDLIARSRQESRLWRALHELLAWPEPASGPGHPVTLRRALRALLDHVPSAPGADEPLERLRAVAGGAAPSSVARSPSELVDDAAYARCLIDQPDAARQLASMHAYLHEARPPERTDLAADHAFTREQLSFVTLLEQPHLLDHLRATFEMFRSAYGRAYVTHHRSYWREAARLRGRLRAGRPTVQALARLNALSALGTPLGAGPLGSCAELEARLASCPSRDLVEVVREQPVCPDCRTGLDDTVPTAEVERALEDVREALERQQRRLASEAVRRILARGGARIERFLQVVQASDVGALTQVLDDELVAFLRELLAEPAPPTPEALDLLRSLARAFPIIGEDDIGPALAHFEELLRAALDAQRGARSPALRMAGEHLDDT